jgi:hypothetical protein
LTAPSGSQNVKSLMVRDKQTFILWVGWLLIRFSVVDGGCSLLRNV